MRSLLRLIDFNQGSMARKVVTHKRHIGGLEAPRNSLELPMESSGCYCDVGDRESCSYQMTEDWSDGSFYPIEAPIKKLISEEISKKPNTRHNAPSIVARLMGVDMLPLDAKPAGQRIDKKNDRPQTNFPTQERTKNEAVSDVPFTSNSSRQTKSNSLQHNGDRDPYRWGGRTKLDKPRPREHPQEEELQKFKKEFEAWQAARFKECAKIVESDSIPSQWLAQANLNKEKMVLYENSRRMTTTEKPMELKGHTVKATPQQRGSSQNNAFKNEPKWCSVKETPYERGDLQHHKCKNELFPAEKKESFSLRHRMQTTSSVQSHLIDSNQKLDISSAPTKIVILRPGPDKISNYEESLGSSLGISEGRGSIEDFLDEVKERLKWELQGKTFKGGNIVRGGGIETPYSEKPSDPKQIAQRIATQVRESVTRDLGMHLPRSESTRSYKSEIQFNGTGSPEFMNKDTRRFLSKRLRNVLKETRQDIPMAGHGISKFSMLDNQRDICEQSRDILNAGSPVSYWDRVKDEPYMQSRSFRRRPHDDVMLHNDMSPRNLIRSLSAPVSGTSLGKLLLEDRHILTGAHIRRNFEAIERATVNVKKQKKEKFNIKEKVSSFKYSFTFRGRLFGRKFQSADESHFSKCDFMKDIMTGPTVITNFGDRHENSTEVPPSPASVCSSVHEDFWRPTDHLSPTATSDVPHLDDDSMPQVFREISSNLNELRRQLNQLAADDNEDTMFEEQPLEAEMGELEDCAKVYIRDLLVASGLYNGSSDKSLSRWDPLARPISNLVFEEVEDSYRKQMNESGGSMKDQGEKKVDHKVLLDLLNEALSIVLGPPVTMSRFMKKAIGPVQTPPHGRRLLDHVWEIIRAYVYPSSEKPYYSLDRMVAQDLQSAPWSGLMDDDVNALGKELEYQIIGDLIEEIVKDMQT